MLSDQDLKKLYGKQYVDSFEQKQSKYRLERLIKQMDLKGTYKVADIACGNGMMMPLVADQVGQYVGVDFSEEFIKAAQRKRDSLSIANAQFELSDIVDFCSANKSVFDVVFAMDFAEHVYDKDWARILCAIKECLKPNGKLYLHTPNGDFFLEKMKANNFIVKQFPEHIAVRSQEQNRAILEKCGFRVNTMKLIPHYNILRVLHPLSFIPGIGKWFKARIFIEATA